MAAISENIKVYVVQRLACFEPLDSIVQAVKQDFGVDVSKPQLLAYDPNKAQGQRLSEKLKSLFEATRKKFLDDTSSIPIANKAVRLNTLQRLVDNAERSKNPVLVADLLEQAAKEMGEAYSNKVAGGLVPGVAYVMPVPTAASVDDWEKQAAMTQGKASGA